MREHYLKKIKSSSPTKQGYQKSLLAQKELPESWLTVNCFPDVSDSHGSFFPLSTFPLLGSRVHGIHLPTVMKVPRSCSVATGLISVRRFTNLPTTSGARRKPRILIGGEKTQPENLQHRQQLKIKTKNPLCQR